MPVDQLKENPEVTRLLTRGKERGVVTYEEINDALGATEQIASSQHGRDGFHLNGGWGFVTVLAHSLHDGRGQVQIVKGHGDEAPVQGAGGIGHSGCSSLAGCGARSVWGRWIQEVGVCKWLASTPAKCWCRAN